MTEYTNDTEMKERLGQDANTARLNLAIAESAQVIEDATGRWKEPGFGLDTSPSARRFRTAGNVAVDDDGHYLIVDDIGDPTDLTVEIGDGTTWTEITDFDTEPLDVLSNGRPVEALRRDSWPFPLVRVTTRWGWPAIPDPIKGANRILAQRYYRRKDASWGVAGFGETGLARLQREDPDVAMQIEPYIRQGF